MKQIGEKCSSCNATKKLVNKELRVYCHKSADVVVEDLAEEVRAE